MVVYSFTDVPGYEQGGVQTQYFPNGTAIRYESNCISVLDKCAIVIAMIPLNNHMISVYLHFEDLPFHHVKDLSYYCGNPG